MNTEMFAERKNILEEFYKERMKFNIYRIDIIQANPGINIYENVGIKFLKNILHLLKTGF